MKRLVAWTILASLALSSCAVSHEIKKPSVGAVPQAVDEAPPEAPLEPGGVGALTVPPGSGEQGLVSLERVTVSARQQGDFAEVEVEHVFKSEAEAVLEGTFRFPLPDDAILTGLAMWIDGVRVDGELVEREKARKVFEEIVDSMQDPALLEWEHGTTFKMRVFPIAPQEEKRVVIRYLAPLLRKNGGLVFAHGARTPGGGKVKQLSVTFDGKPVFSEGDVAEDRVVEVKAKAAAKVLAEMRKDATYTMVRFEPDWSKVPKDPAPAPKNWIFVVDTSRSALEERPLAVKTLRTLASGLPPGSRFRVATSDLEFRVDPAGFRPVSPSAVDEAARFVEGVEADGATDLGVALAHAGVLSHDAPQAAVVYIGDCEPTWGETNADALLQAAEHALAGTPLHVVLLGADADAALGASLAERTQGRLLRARRAEDVDAFARSLAHPVKRITDVAFTTDAGGTVLAGEKKTLSYGESAVVFVKTEGGKPGPRVLDATARALGKSVQFKTYLDARPEGAVAERYGSQWVRHLERTGGAKEDIVAASLEYGVMSKHTSFLVLESEEAYARYAIERKAKREAEGPRVTGADLESSSADGASMNLTRVQPGDPEITIDAPDDAVSVRVVFPFGETKDATHDPEANGGRGGWMVRFLVPRETAEGRYEAVAYIVHRDGRTEARKVGYTVDRTAPELTVEVKRDRLRPDFVRIHVTQRAASGDVDLRRVEVAAPSGEIVELTALRWGEFVGTVRAPRGEAGTLRVLGVDQALNHAARVVELSAELP